MVNDGPDAAVETRVVASPSSTTTSRCALGLQAAFVEAGYDFVLAAATVAGADRRTRRPRGRRRRARPVARRRLAA